MEKIPLKKIVNHQNKTIIVSFFTMVMLTLYFISGTFHIGEPRFLPLTSFEMKIPFLIDSIWIYVMMYPFLTWSLFSYRCEDNFNHLLYSFVLVAMITFIIFQLFPVGYPREFYPLPHANTPSVNLFYKVRWIDSPMNCFPSLHVSLCYLFTFAHWSESKKAFWFSFVLTTLISISTLTTKQHYIADVVAGFILSLGVFLMVKKFTKIVLPR
jgi:membrane-associated phospholipid phosphatase